jgi:KDO2-lipid IV(A) lauroyltransferase
LERVDMTQLDERLAELEEAGEGELVFVSGHLGGIEVGGAVLACRRRMVNVIARRVENPYLDEVARRGRQARGLRIHPRRGGIKPLVKAVESGEDAALLIDQNQRKRGLFLPFFGRLASTDRSAAVLAMRRGVARPVLVGFAIRRGPAFRFTMEFAPVIRPTERELAGRDLAGLTRRITAAMEEIILRHPEQYLWLHDRYKTRPPGEREEGGGSPG